MNKKFKKVIGYSVIAVVAAGVIGAGMYNIGAHSTQSKIDALKSDLAIEKAKPAVVNTVTVTKEVPVEKIVTVEKNVTVIDEQSKLDLETAMQYIKNHENSDITFNYVVFETHAQVEAESYIRSNLVQMFKDDDMFKSTGKYSDYRMSEVTISHISDATISDTDYDKKDATLTYDVKVRAKVSGDTATYDTYTVVIPFQDGTLQDSDVTYEAQ